VTSSRAENRSIRKRVSELLPELFGTDPPTIQGSEPVVLTGSLLKHSEVHFLPAGRIIPSRGFEIADVTLHAAFGSYGILKKVAGSSPKDYYKTLWSKSADIPVWIGSCRFEDSFDQVLEAFSLTKFGGARVSRDSGEAIVTLSDAVGLISRGKLSTHATTGDVCSAPITIADDRPIIEAIKMMISHNIRRLFVELGPGKFVSDRTIIDYMFSLERLEVARDNPEAWIDEEVSKLPTKNPGRCKTGDLDDAAKALGPAPDDCLMTDEWQVISRWDMVVKPWRTGKLAAVDN